MDRPLLFGQDFEYFDMSPPMVAPQVFEPPRRRSDIAKARLIGHANCGGEQDGIQAVDSTKTKSVLSTGFPVEQYDPARRQ